MPSSRPRLRHASVFVLNPFVSSWTILAGLGAALIIAASAQQIVDPNATAPDSNQVDVVKPERYQDYAWATDGHGNYLHPSPPYIPTDGEGGYLVPPPPPLPPRPPPLNALSQRIDVNLCLDWQGNCLGSRCAIVTAVGSSIQAGLNSGQLVMSRDLPGVTPLNSSDSRTGCARCSSPNVVTWIKSAAGMNATSYTTRADTRFFTGISYKLDYCMPASCTAAYMLRQYQFRDRLR
jgi:hypothetical protein